MYSWLTEEREIAAEGRKVMALCVCVCCVLCVGGG